LSQVDTVKESQRILLKKRKQIGILYNEAYAIKESLQGICDHSLTEEYQWEHDNGYGRQTKMTSKRCVFCGWVSLWNNNHYIDPNNLTD
jgi:hypothetical protein